MDEVGGAHFTFVSVPGVPPRNRHSGRVAEILELVIMHQWCIDFGAYNAKAGIVVFVFCYWKGEKEGKMWSELYVSVEKMLGKEMPGCYQC
jgi:hypothetical protein